MAFLTLYPASEACEYSFTATGTALVRWRASQESGRVELATGSTLNRSPGIVTVRMKNATESKGPGVLAWLDADPDDDEPARFEAYLYADPEAFRHILDTVRAGHLPELSVLVTGDAFGTSYMPDTWTWDNKNNPQVALADWVLRFSPVKL